MGSPGNHRSHLSNVRNSALGVVALPQGGTVLVSLVGLMGTNIDYLSTVYLEFSKAADASFSGEGAP